MYCTYIGCVVGAENVLLMRLLDRRANDYTVAKVVAQWRSEVYRGYIVCTAEKTSVPQVELVQSTERERAVYTFACVWFEFVLVALTCNISWSLWETRL